MDTFRVRYMYFDSRLNGMMHISAMRMALLPDLIENFPFAGHLHLFMEFGGLLVFPLNPRTSPVLKTSASRITILHCITVSFPL